MLNLSESRLLLQVEISASEDEIKKAFRRRSKELHPDVNPAPDAHEQFVRLQQARDLLIEQLGQPEPSAEDVPRYRPAKEVSNEERDAIIRASRRRQRQEQSRQSRRRSRTRSAARRAEQENQAFQQEMERRRAERERQQQERRAREQAERREQEREDAERAARAQAAAERRREEEQREAARRRLEQLQREERERAREAQERQRRTPSIDNEQVLRCAWKDCQVTDSLSPPVTTPLGLRRFCGRHQREYLQWKRSRSGAKTGVRSGSAAGR